MTIQDYITDINKEHKTGRATEHSYRGYLQHLIKSIAKDVMVTNEPVRVKCGAPDYIITKNDIPVGYIEAKDVGYKLDDKQYKEQFDRYRKSLNNLIITDYIDFWLYVDGVFIKSVKIAEVVGKEIKPLTENHTEFTNLIKDFCTHVGQTIKSSKKLAEMMAGKARMLAEVIEKALLEDEADNLNPDTALQAQLHAFKDILIHDIKPKEFADIYAQTIAYGMFAARLHDPTLPTFSRQEAAELIPKTNPFLRKLFQYIAGYDLDTRLVWIVDGLAEIFRATDVAALLKNFGNSTKTNDPIIHFYETFLTEYDPALRKARGVWYTPEPVVNFIVRAVDDILKTEFNLKDGLADTSKVKIKLDTQNFDKKTGKHKQIEKEVHKVQILDPATGTGTFLAEVVKHIYNTKFEGQQGIWSKYVDEHLVPRLNGFELLMASYAMAHLKLDMLLTETGYKQSTEQRFKIYLTNSLEEHHQDTGTLFANWLSAEANEANHIKRDTPVMVIIGNPPYSGESKNKGEWISNLMEDYKKEPEGKVKLKEQNSKFINDDYVKFIRFGQYFI
ncbi:MAG TPA: N-6 DNA methylase, partial [Bacteroidia bacterium]